MDKSNKKMVKVNGKLCKPINVEIEVWQHLMDLKTRNLKRNINDVIKELLQKDGKVFKLH